MDISVRAIFTDLFRKAFKLTDCTTKYDFWMNYLKKVKMLNMDYKMMHYMWMAGHIAEVGLNTP